MVNTLELLRIHDLSHIVGIPHSTAAKWIKEFDMYIPKTQKQDGIYYHAEAIDVLTFVKKCKDQHYKKQPIIKMLADKSYPITETSSIKDVQAALDQGNYKENILTVMQTIGKTAANVANQEKWINALVEQQNKHKRQIKIIEKQTDEINDLKQDIKELKQEHTNARDYKLKKLSFAKLFET
jgi:HAMP domain-containing protein